MNDARPAHRAPLSRNLLLVIVVLAALLALIFRRSFVSELTVFSNDGPLGAISAASGALPSGFFGVWSDLNWLGSHGIGASPNFSSVLAWITGPVLFSKIYPAVALLILGLCTWFCLRQFGFKPMVCIIGAIASVLNMDVFSTACWGLPNWSLARAMVFLALAALAPQATKKVWARAALGGLAVGMSVMEGFDMGAIYSLYIAAFVFFTAFLVPGDPSRKILKGGARVAIVAFCAAFIAAQSLSALIGTQIKGISGAQQDEKTKEEQWDWATQWSLPKIEALRVVIPGLFGYRMDTPDGGNYWGRVGQQAGWDQHHQGYSRHSGSGEYAGVLVVLIALWAVGQSFRGAKSPYEPIERKLIWFWAAAALISLLFAFGRHAPFYRLIYALPYFSTIRNPIKFMHPFQVGLLILFGYGLQDLCRRYLANGASKVSSFSAHLKSWWATVTGFDKKWTLATIAATALSVLALLLYAASRTELQKHLTEAFFDPTQAAAVTELRAAATARFSIGEVGWFVFFMIVSCALVVLIVSGWLKGPRAKWGWLLLGLVLTVDLGRANQPWIIYYNYKQKYGSNPIIDILRDRPYDHRVAVLPDPRQFADLLGLFQSLMADKAAQERTIPVFSTMQQVYHGLWMQHHFQFYNIQALEMIQEPRKAQEKLTYENALRNSLVRYLELTGTRFMLGVKELIEPMNQQLDPGKNRFKLHTAFTLTQETADGPILASTNAAGPFALIEFTGALPSARLYSNWRVVPDERATLGQLADPAFDPHQTIIVATALPTPSSNAAINQPPGHATIAEYAPKRLALKSESSAATVLLLNDRFDPDWKVTVDGKPETLLRCNYIVRGVYLTPGNHTIEFRFEPPVTGFYVSLSAIVLGVLLCGIVALPAKVDSSSMTSPPGPDSKGEKSDSP